MNKTKISSDSYISVKLCYHQTENAYKIRSLLNSHTRYTPENRQSSLLDFNPLLSDGDWRLMWKASHIYIIADSNCRRNLTAWSYSELRGLHISSALL